MYTAEFSKTRRDKISVHYIYPNDLPEQTDQFEFVLIYKNGTPVLQLGIHLYYHCSPFRQIEFWKGFVAIGLEDVFILFNITSGAQLVNKCSGYFGHIYIEDENIYIATADEVMCYNDKPSLKWMSDTLGIDGVIITEIGQTFLKGSGQHDPPDGWNDFVITKETGKIIKDSDKEVG
ncbi:MAG TPA: hypothetical protein VJU78_20925 [Chitinophagaceae bacterium]|nr:hypothetical protein [Chitinophagaceae bacterium]